MPMYRKKPLMVEAHMLTDTNTEEIAKWCGGRVVAVGVDNSLSGLEIPTLEGVMLGYPSCYIVKGIKGEFYPVQASIFEESYQQVGIRDV